MYCSIADPFIWLGINLKAISSTNRTILFHQILVQSSGAQHVLIRNSIQLGHAKTRLEHLLAITCQNSAGNSGMWATSHFFPAWECWAPAPLQDLLEFLFKRWLADGEQLRHITLFLIAIPFHASSLFWNEMMLW